MIPQGRQRAKSGHEHKDADILGVTLIAMLVLLLVAVSLLTAGGVVRFAVRADKPTARLFANPAQFPKPRLEAHPVAAYTAAKGDAEMELHSYGWVDRKAGMAHIPIEEAMTLLVQRGLPNVGGGQTRLQLMQGRAAEGMQSQNPPAPTPEGTSSR